jgi:hypothetical protein
MDKFLWGKLFLTSSSFCPYFLWNFWSQLGPPFDRISLNYFKLIQINAKPYCSSGLGHPAFFSGRPTRARTLSVPTDKPAPPVIGTAARYCATAHPSDASLPSLFPSATRAWRTLLASASLGALPGVVRQPVF